MMLDGRTLTVPLSSPLMVAGREVSSITLREPTIDELRLYSPFREEPYPGGGHVLRLDGEALTNMLLACALAPIDVVDALFASLDIPAVAAIKSALLVLCAPRTARRFADHLAPEHQAALPSLN